MRVRLPSLQEIEVAANRLAPHVLSLPLLRLGDDDGLRDISLKLENLQPGGSFKIRPLGNAVLSLDDDASRYGVYTASSGNSGLALASIARQVGVAATVYVPHSAPETKLQRIRTLGARIVTLPDDEWWRVIQCCGHSEDPGCYVDAVRSQAALAGNGTMGMEIAEQSAEVETVVVPFGGGGVACGIAAALVALKPGVRIIVAECDTAAPATAAFRAGRPVEVDVRPSIISGAGAPRVLDEMWPLVSSLVSETIVVSLEEVEEAIRMLAGRHRVVVEGAGAISVAAAMRAGGSMGKTVCVVTGGNIDFATLARIVGRHPTRSI